MENTSFTYRDSVWADNETDRLVYREPILEPGLAQ